MRIFNQLTPGHKVIVIAALIAGVFTLVGALIDLGGMIYQTNKPILVTQTAEAKLTAGAIPVNTPQPSATSMNTVNLTPTQTPAPAFNPTTPPVLTPLPELLLTSTTTPALTETSTPTSSPTKIPITPLSFVTLFTQCRDTKFLNGNAILNITPGCEEAQTESAIQLVWTVPNNLSDTGCILSLASIADQAFRNEALVFWARSIDTDEQISVKLKDDVVEVGKLVSLSTEWQQVVLNLIFDFPGINMQKIQSLTIGIDYDKSRQVRNGRGTACFSDFGFGTP
jgi:hypothetical protein